MPAAAADAQVQPSAAALQALLAAERTRCDVLYPGDMAATLRGHRSNLACFEQRQRARRPFCLSMISAQTLSRLSRGKTATDLPGSCTRAPVSPHRPDIRAAPP